MTKIIYGILVSVHGKKDFQLRCGPDASLISIMDSILANINDKYIKDIIIDVMTHEDFDLNRDMLVKNISSSNLYYDVDIDAYPFRGCDDNIVDLYLVKIGNI